MGAEQADQDGNLRLSAYLRFFRTRDQDFVESVLTEQGLLLDPVLRAVLGELDMGPLPPQQLIERVVGSGVAQPPEVLARLGMLDDQGLLVESADQDHSRFLAALAGPAPYPVVDQVELTNVCPLRCIMCSRGHTEMSRPLGFMELELFRDLVDQIADVQHEVKPLVLHNAGESLLHTELDALVRIAADRGLRPELSVNPGFLPLERYLALRDAGLARLVISLDGVTAPTLERIRGAAARGQRALANIVDILRHRTTQH